jgi:protein phosphatase
MIPAETSEFRVSSASRPGKGGEQNEDRFRIAHFSRDEEKPGDSVFAVLVDGIGAQRAGEVAAELAAEVVLQAVSQSDASQPTGILQAAIIQAGQVVRHRSESRREWNGMGCTTLCAWLLGRKLYAASVGNSRLFLLRQKKLHLLNVPITHPRHAVEKPRRSRKTQPDDPLLGYLGSKSPVEVDLRLAVEGHASQRNQGLRLQPNDRLLLCSDGVGDALKSGEIAEILGKRELDLAAQAVVDLALEKGSSNDLTAIVLAVPPGRPPLLARQINWKRALAKVSIVALLILAGLLAWWLWLGQIGVPPGPLGTPINTLTPVITNTAVP